VYVPGILKLYVKLEPKPIVEEPIFHSVVPLIFMLVLNVTDIGAVYVPGEGFPEIDIDILYI